MSRLWDIYEELKEIVYVSDPDTYELVYVNRFGREACGVSSLEQLVGKRCYEILHGCTSPCSVCTNDQLQVGHFCEWRRQNPLLNKTFMIKDTLIEEDGHIYRLEIAIDIGKTYMKEPAIPGFTSDGGWVHDALRLSLAEPTPEKSIEALLKHLGQLLKSDRVYIFEETPAHTVSNTYEWCRADVEPQKERRRELPIDLLRLWYEVFDQNQNVMIKSPEDIRDSDPKMYEALLPQQVNSLVVSPIISNKTIIGFYGVDNPPKEFLEYISVMLTVFGDFIASILQRRDLVDRLQKLGYYDQLTGALNRNGMNEFVATVDHEASLGIVYCDVMGLKQINDTLGHLAGDDLLIRACRCLCEVFPKESVFRFGGDEFLVLDSHVAREEQDAAIATLRRIMPTHHLQMAIGSVWVEHCNGQVTELLKLADQRMYAEKAEFYSQKPHNRRQRRSES